MTTNTGGFVAGQVAPNAADSNSTLPNGMNRGSNNGSFDTSRQDSLSRIAENKPQWRPGQQNGDDPNPLRDSLGSSNNRSPGEFKSPDSGTQSNTAQVNGKQTSDKQTANTQNNRSAMQSGPDPSALANVAPLSDQRGADWALPTRTPGATPYRRPIRVECFGDRYIVYPNDEALRPIQVAVNSTNVDQAIDQLIHQVWKQIEGWGMAEIGGYWKPVLRLAPDATGTRRAEELARKLEGSGIEIERIWR